MSESMREKEIGKRNRREILASSSGNTAFVEDGHSVETSNTELVQTVGT